MEADQVVVGDGNPRTKVSGCSGNGDNQTGEDPDLVKLGCSLRSSFRIVGLAGHEVLDGPLGGRQRLTLFVTVHDPNASGSSCLARLGAVFDLPNAPADVRPDLQTTLEDTWVWLAKPGTWWNAAERRQIAEVTRAARLRRQLPEDRLPEPATHAAIRLGGSPASTTPDWVAEMVSALGEESYAELLGITSAVVAIDTFTRLVGSEPEALLEPQPGEPTRTRIARPFKKSKTWITMGPMSVPPYVLSIVPDAMIRGNAIEDTLYMSGEEMGDPDFTRGFLHRTQIELVAGSLSWANECFY